MNPDFFLLEPCKSANGLEIKFKNKHLDLPKISGFIEKKGGVCGPSTLVVLLAKLDDFELSIYASGRIMVKSKSISKDATHAFCTNLAADFSSLGFLIDPL